MISLFILSCLFLGKRNALLPEAAFKDESESIPCYHLKFVHASRRKPLRVHPGLRIHSRAVTGAPVRVLPCGSKIGFSAPSESLAPPGSSLSLGKRLLDFIFAILLSVL